MFRRILAAVDGSPRAGGVVRAARAIAAQFDAQVFLYRAIEVLPEFPAAAANAPDELRPWLAHEAAEALRTLAGDDPRVSVEPPAILHGQPWRDILATAARLDVDLIVIGSHGYGGWDRVLGTTCGKVTNHAERSVLVVRERRPEEPAEATLPGGKR